MAHATLRDVAARSGVSVRTVSNVVTGSKAVAEHTRARVERAVQELGYRPNMVARSLRSGRSNIIAVAVPELNVPYFAELVGEMTVRARDRGYTVMVDQTDGTPERERELIAAHSPAQMFDGMIVNALSLTAAEIRGRDHRLPLVLLGEHLSDGSFDHVGVDNVAAARAATTHLIGLGARRVAAIGVLSPATETAQLRLLGYTQAHRLDGREVDARLVAVTEAFHRVDGATAMARLLDLPEPPDAVFCFNDLLALGACRTLHERGLKIPEDVAVVGFDDIEDGRYATPSLTTIAPDKVAIAGQAVDLLISRITATAGASPQDLWAGWTLEIRESTVRGSSVRRSAGRS